MAGTEGPHTGKWAKRQEQHLEYVRVMRKQLWGNSRQAERDGPGMMCSPGFWIRKRMLMWKGEYFYSVRRKAALQRRELI